MRTLRLSLAVAVSLLLLGGVVGAVVAQSDEAGESAFPTGTFVAEEDELALELRADGTCLRASVPCTYGVSGDLFSEMSFEEPSGPQVPATYYWDFDGERLTFEPWAEDPRPSRQEVYAEHTYRLVEAGEPLIQAAESAFPTGTLVEAESGSFPTLVFREDGTFYAALTHEAMGNYAINGDLYTEMTNDWSHPPAEVPVTYRWHWDDEQLSFSLWGEDSHPYRTAFYTDHAYVLVPTAIPSGVRRLMLSHMQLDVWVTVEFRQGDDGTYVATATIDAEPLGEGAGETLQEAVKAALEPLGEPYASDMAATVEG